MIWILVGFHWGCSSIWTWWFVFTNVIRDAIHGLTQPCLDHIELLHHKAELAKHVVQILVNINNPGSILNIKLLFTYKRELSCLLRVIVV